MKFYQKNWFVILMLILFFPVGLFLMWKYANWRNYAKIIVTVAIALLVVVSYSLPADYSSTSDQSASVQTQKSEKTTESKKETKEDKEKTKKHKETKKEKAAAKKQEEKAAAQALDFQLYNCYRKGAALFDSFSELDDSASSDKAYSRLGNMKQDCENIYSILDGLKIKDRKNGKGSEDYEDAVRYYVDCIYLFSGHMQKYMDSGKEKHYNSAMKDLSAASSAKSDIDTARNAFLKSAGFSSDEISEIVDAEK